MRLARFIKYLFLAFFSRVTIILIYWLITLFTCFQVMIRSSLLVGASALIACGLCYWGAAAFMGSLLERRQKGYRAIDLVGIGALSVVLIAAGQALMVWSGFWLHLFDVEIGGALWVAMILLRCAKERNTLSRTITACA